MRRVDGAFFVNRSYAVTDRPVTSQFMGGAAFCARVYERSTEDARLARVSLRRLRNMMTKNLGFVNLTQSSPTMGPLLLGYTRATCARSITRSFSPY